MEKFAKLTGVRPRVEFLDLHWQTNKISSEVKRGWKRVLADSSFVLSKQVEEFEIRFADFMKVNHCVGVANGTDALEIGLRALGVGDGDEVIVPANSFVASAIAVSRAGAKPVLVDCEPGTWLLDVAKVARSITANTRALMPVHLYGQMADMNGLLSLAEEHGLHIIEDVAQAQGALQHGLAAGSVGAVSATSFYPGKNLGAMGDGGAVLTNSSNLADSARALRNYGSQVKYEHPIFGFNSRLDSLQAIVLLAKLKWLDQWNLLRQSQAELYLSRLQGIDEIKLPAVGAGNSHVWHLFVVHVENRDEVARDLLEAGIATGIHYPTPIHLLGMYQELGYSKGDFPIAEESSRTALSLPLYPGLRKRDQSYIISEVRRILRNRKA